MNESWSGCCGSAARPLDFSLVRAPRRVARVHVDVRRYLPVVRFLAMAGAAFGAMMLAIDCAVGMSLPRTVAEGPYVVVLSAVVLWFSGRRRFPPSEAAATPPNLRGFGTSSN
jgi:hypothetical protein